LPFNALPKIVISSSRCPGNRILAGLQRVSDSAFGEALEGYPVELEKPHVEYVA